MRASSPTTTTKPIRKMTPTVPPMNFIKVYLQKLAFTS